MVKVSPPSDDHQAQTMRARSGFIDTSDRLVTFLYVMLRDHVHPGDVEYVMKQLDHDPHTSTTDPDKHVYQLTNGWVAEYARDVAKRLRMP